MRDVDWLSTPMPMMLLLLLYDIGSGCIST